MSDSRFAVASSISPVSSCWATSSRSRRAWARRCRRRARSLLIAGPPHGTAPGPGEDGSQGYEERQGGQCPHRPCPARNRRVEENPVAIARPEEVEHLLVAATG